MRTRRRRRWLRAAGVLLLLLVAGRLALAPLVARRTRQILASLDGYRGDFSDVSVSVLRLSYTIQGLSLRREPAKGRAPKVRPRLRVKRIEIGLDLRATIRNRAIVAAVEVEEPAVDVTIAASGTRAGGDPRIGEKMSQLSPLAIERIEIKRARVAFADEGRAGSPSVYLHDLDAALENLATRPTLSKGEPALAALSGTLQKTGQVSVFLTADPFAERVTFSGRAAVKGLDLREVRSFLVDEGDVDPRRGTLDLLAGFQVREGHLRGGVKPALKDVQVSAAKPGPAPKLKEWLLERGQRPGEAAGARRSLRGFVPIRGDVVQPDADLWPTVLRVLRNAFSTGLSAGLGDLPPPERAGSRSPQARTPTTRGRSR